MRVLVTGGAGYVGGYLVDAALAAGHEVRVYDKLVYEDAYLKNIDFVFGDVNDIESLKPHLDWADALGLYPFRNNGVTPCIVAHGYSWPPWPWYPRLLAQRRGH